MKVLYSIIRVLCVGLFYFGVGTFLCYWVLLKNSSLSEVASWELAIKAGIAGGVLLGFIALIQELRYLFSERKKDSEMKEGEEKKVEVKPMKAKKKIKKKESNPDPDSLNTLFDLILIF